jgi:FKBP-type peptidyl-prolyl cis-trans isomerase FkpA
MRSFIFIFIIIFFSCSSEKDTEKRFVIKHTKESLQEVNKLLVDKDAEIIKNYIKRRGWDMNVTETGLWYEIYQKGEGTNVKRNDLITYNYNVWLLNGTLCYSSDSLGLGSFVVGKGRVESGLEEGVLMLKKGSKSRFIIPPHLAHGLIGDENRIPARATLVYDIEIVDIQK